MSYENVSNNGLMVCHKYLRRTDDDPLFQSVCPLCGGTLSPKIDQNKRIFLQEDRCMSCGQLYQYRDINEVNQKLLSIEYDYLKERENDLLEEMGWYGHYVTECKEYPYGVNYHTHGFDRLGARDIQICFPIPPEIAHKIFWSIFKSIKAGMALEPNKIYTSFLPRNNQSLFIDKMEGDRLVLRLLLPDRDGVVEKEKTHPHFKLQWD